MQVREITVEEHGRRELFIFLMTDGTMVSFATNFKCHHGGGVVVKEGFVVHSRVRKIRIVGDQFCLTFQDDGEVSVSGKMKSVAHEGGVKITRYVTQ